MQLAYFPIPEDRMDLVFPQWYLLLISTAMNPDLSTFRWTRDIHHLWIDVTRIVIITTTVKGWVTQQDGFRYRTMCYCKLEDSTTRSCTRLQA